jgi:hypothetical protein
VLLGLSVLTGLFAAPPVMFMLPAIVRDELHAGAHTLGTLTAVGGLGSLLGAVGLLALSARANKGEPVVLAYAATAIAVVVMGLGSPAGLWLALATIGLARTLLTGLSTVVVQAFSSEAMRARVLSVWVLASAGVIPLGALLTGALAGPLGVDGAVLVVGLALLVGGAALLVRRPQVLWLGCTTLPASCLAGSDPAAVAVQTSAGSLAPEPRPTIGGHPVLNQRSQRPNRHLSER